MSVHPSMSSLSSLLSSLPLKQHKRNRLRLACKWLLYLFVYLLERKVQNVKSEPLNTSSCYLLYFPTRKLSR